MSRICYDLFYGSIITVLSGETSVNLWKRGICFEKIAEYIVCPKAY